MQFDDTGEHFYSYFDPLSLTANILRGDVGGFQYNTGHWYAPCAMTGGIFDTPMTLTGLIAHELIGHGGGAISEPAAIFWEDQHYRNAGQPLRCGGM